MNDIALHRPPTADLIALAALYGAKNYKPLAVVLTRRDGVPVAAHTLPGPTVAIVAFSTAPQSPGGFGPSAPGFNVLPSGAAAALEAAIGPNTVAFLVEPIQGEAGVIIPPAGYLKRARELCTERRAILILDEIQTGLGRTGKLLAEEHEGVEADLTLIGKA